MFPKSLTILLLLVSSFVLVNCASNERFAYDVNAQETFGLSTAQGGGQPFIWPGAIDNTEGNLGDGDDDGSTTDDGSNDNPDGEDPNCDNCDPTDVDLCFNMKLYAYGVSSAVVDLNHDRIIYPHEFHNESYKEIEREIELEIGSNLLEFGANLRGSPGDRLEIQILDCATEEPELLYETVLTRQTGQPQTETFILP